MKTSLAILLLLGSVAHADAPDHDRFVRRTIAVAVGSIGAASIIVGALHAIGSIEDRTGRAVDVLVCNAGGVAGQADAGDLGRRSKRLPGVTVARRARLGHARVVSPLRVQ